MIQFEWSDEYEVDGGPVDEEHKALIGLANKVFDFTDVDQQVDEVKQTVHALFDYTRTHFDHEEDLMRQVGYPRLPEHAERHKKIIREMTKALQTHTVMAEFVAELRPLMVDWVIQHILDEDRQIGQYIRGQQGPAAEASG